MQIGALTAFLSYLLQILMSVMMATFMLVMVPRAEVSAERITEVLGTEPDVVPPADPVRLPEARGQLELRDVEFRYPGAEEPVLCDIGLQARPGDVTGGAVRIDGVDVRELDPAILSAAIGLVPQKPYLFSGTVASNLRYGKTD